MKKLPKELASFDSLYKDVIGKVFNQIVDSRASNAHYDLLDILRCGFALYSLKCSSLFSFRKRSQAEENNLKSIYQIEKVASDNTLRNVLDSVPSEKLRKGFHSLFKRIKKLGLLKAYGYWRGHVVVSIDGVEHFCSKKISCTKCMVRKHRDGSHSHYHSMLSAAIVHPDKSPVFVLDNEPIVKQDGSTKNDCERNAAYRLIEHLQGLYKQEHMVFVLDALYACGPVIRKLQTNTHWQYIINITPEGNKGLFSQFEARDKRGSVKWHTRADEKGTHRFGYTNNLALNSANAEIRVNMLYYQWTDLKGVTKTFTWITSIGLTKANVFKVMKMGRSRWKIENEVFNTLKNQQYNFEHNFGHGQDNLSTNFAYLMMMAFCVDQIQQSSCLYFRKILGELKTRIKFWESIRAVFKIIPCKNMKTLFCNLAQLYQIQIE